MHRDDTTWPAADREQLLAALRKPLPPSKAPTKHVERDGRWRWRWWCTDDTTGEVLKSGHRPTETWAWTRAEAAAKRIHDERLEAE